MCTIVMLLGDLVAQMFDIRRVVVSFAPRCGWCIGIVSTQAMLKPHPQDARAASAKSIFLHDYELTQRTH